MRSSFAEEFNHDAEAARYDTSVRNERDPIRTGYRALLDWVVATAAIGRDCRVLDLGSGTGNLGVRIERCASLTCVDLSARMTEIARDKVAHLRNATFVLADLLDYMTASPAPCDVLLSTYAIHHLTGREKSVLIESIGSHLSEGGRAIFGDLMFENAAARETILAELRATGQAAVVEAIEEEFFWDLSTELPALEQAGFEVESRRFSQLSWGLSARKRSEAAH